MMRRPVLCSPLDADNMINAGPQSGAGGSGEGDQLVNVADADEGCMAEPTAPLALRAPVSN